jgi:hypothetical protein
MHTSRKSKGLAVALAATALLGTALSGGAAKADSLQYSAPFVGVGSDTTQDILNAFQGYSNGVYYTPVHSDVASGSKVLTSWDATDAGSTTSCIAARTGGPSFNRPNGSGSGRTALLAAITTGGTTSVSNCGAGTTSPSGQISFARSSSLSGTAGTTLAYVPFARDALSYAAYRAAGSPVLDLSTTELNQIFTTPAGVDIVRGTAPNTVTTRVLGCGIQSGSGTGTTWQGFVTGNTATYQTTVCDGLIDPATGVAVGRSQENDGPGLVLRGNLANTAVAGTQVIIGFSVGNFIAISNGVAPGTMPATVLMGANPAVAAGVSPIVGTIPNLTGNAAYYSSSFGRDLYNVLPATVINSPLGNGAIKQIFKSTFNAPVPPATVGTILVPSEICKQGTTIEKFGFLQLPNCGDSTSIIRGA